MKTFKIITFGCRVNQAESRLIGEGIIKSIRGITSTTSIKGADLVIINTCCVTHKAEREVRRAIRKAKRENPNCCLVVIGCLIDKIKNNKIPAKNINLKAIQQADLLLQNKDKPQISKIIKKITNKKSTQFAVRSHMKYCTFKNVYYDKYAKGKKALVKIQEGCDNFCTYCIVPKVRGRYMSIKLMDILERIGYVEEKGMEEIVLTGIHIGKYGVDLHSFDLSRLLEEILSRVTIKRIRINHT